MVRYTESDYRKGEKMKGYYTHYGYMGYIDGSYRLFATEEEYYDIYKGEQK